MLATNYQSTLRNVPEELRSHYIWCLTSGETLSLSCVPVSFNGSITEPLGSTIGVSIYSSERFSKFTYLFIGSDAFKMPYFGTVYGFITFFPLCEVCGTT